MSVSIKSLKISDLSVVFAVWRVILVKLFWPLLSSTIHKQGLSRQGLSLLLSFLLHTSHFQQLHLDVYTDTHSWHNSGDTTVFVRISCSHLRCLTVVNLSRAAKRSSQVAADFSKASWRLISFSTSSAFWPISLLDKYGSWPSSHDSATLASRENWCTSRTNTHSHPHTQTRA